jgi:hypothetical protein
MVFGLYLIPIFKNTLMAKRAVMPSVDKLVKLLRLAVLKCLQRSAKKELTLQPKIG